MTADDVLQFCIACEALRIPFWIDGGWAVDVVLGRVTRPHDDLDIAIEERHVAALREFLESQAYVDVPRDDSHRWNFVLGDAHGRQIDVHALVFDADSNVIEGIPYPRESLHGSGGEGLILGRHIRCITPEYLLTFRTGYTIREKDRHDVRLLCERFSFELPAEYRAAC